MHFFAIWKQFNLDSKFMFYELHDVEYVTLNNAGQLNIYQKKMARCTCILKMREGQGWLSKHLPNYRLLLLIASNIKFVVCWGKCTHYTKFWKMCIL
jgi:hypothetical protein